MLSDILPTGFECGVLNGAGRAGRDGRDRRRRPRRPGRAPDGAVLLAGRDHLDRSRREPAGGRASRFGATGTINSGDGKAAETLMAHDRRPRRRHRDRGRRRPGHVPALPGHRGARRHDREHRRAREQGRPAPRAAVVAQHHDHHPARRHGRPRRCCSRPSGRARSIRSSSSRTASRSTRSTEAYETFGHAADTHALKVLIEA